jgi:ribonuclease P protein subunit POP4
MLNGKHYSITRENILTHEIIGLPIEIVNSTDANKVGIQGRIVDETKNTVVVDTATGEKIIPKQETVLSITLGKETVIVDGNAIQFRSEDRTKKKWKARG